MILRRLFAVVALLVSTSASAATITIVNKDAAGVGFNDTTPASAIGGNSGTTLGAQRMNVFLSAAQIWGSKLQSNIPIRVTAKFGPLTPCDAFGGVLGSAGATTFIRFSGSPQPDTWYPVALASALAGTDFADQFNLPDNASVDAEFNGAIGTANCLPGSKWYLGLDGHTPAGQIDLLTVVLHEFGHGLGFASLVNRDGTMPNGFPDIFTRLTFDNSTQMFWNFMSAAQRVTSSTNNGNVVWNATNVTAAATILASGKDASGRPRLYAPSTYDEGSSISHFDEAASPNQLMEPFINSDLTHNVDLPNDLTMKQMLDIGWKQQGPSGCFTLQVQSNAPGGNVIVNTPENCEGGYTPGTPIQMTTSAPASLTFGHWSVIGAGTFSSTTTNPTTFTIAGNSTVIANFQTGTTSQILLNGGFEETAATGNTTPNWTVVPTPGHVLLQKGGSFPRSGSTYAFLGAGDNSVDVIKQTVTIPAGAFEANLTFFVNVVTSEEIGQGAFDTLTVSFQNANGTAVQAPAVLSNEHATSSNNTAGNYIQVGPIDVTHLKGQTLQLVFEARTDFSLPTTFRIDDVSLAVAQSDNTPTASITAPSNGATVAGFVNVVASASDDKGVASLEIWIDGVRHHSATNANSLTFTWNTFNVANGAHSILARATDTGGQTTTSSTVNVTVSNGVVTVTASDADAREAGANIGSFIITRTGSTAQPVTVHYSMSGTASSGSDYFALPGNVTIPAGQSSAGVVLTPVDDAQVESVETAVLTIGGGSYAIGSPNSATVTLSDNDDTVSFLALETMASESGKTGTVSVTRPGPMDAPLTVNYTISGTATNGVDYVTLPGSITIPMHMPSVLLTLTPLADTLSEPMENVTLTIAASPNYKVGTSSQASFTIENVNTTRDAAHDFNGDSRSELLWRHATTNQLAMWELNGRQLLNGGIIGSVPDANDKVMGFGDFNSDRKDDVVLQHAATGQVTIWTMNGRTALAKTPIFRVTDANWKMQAIGDIHGDGKDEIVWRHMATGQIAIWETNGAQLQNGGIIQTVVSDFNWQILTMADLTGDGRDEILWHNSATRQISVWVMNGRALSSATIVTTVPAGWTLVGVGDYNGDRMSDLMWRNGTMVAMWHMNGLGAPTKGNPFPISMSAEWILERSGDFNADGKDEAIWHNATTRQVAMWEMNGMTLFNSGVFFTVSDSNWKLQPRGL